MDNSWQIMINPPDFHPFPVTFGVSSPQDSTRNRPGHMAIEPSQVFRQIAAIVAGHLWDIWTDPVVDP